MRHWAADRGTRYRAVLRSGFGPTWVSASVNELLSTDEMAQADRLAVASGVAGIQLMENAGRAVADTVAARHRLGTRIAVVTGPGNNGGDGFVAARLLGERGYLVRVLTLAGPDRLTGDAALAARAFSGATEPASAEALAGADVVVDALFGAGLARPVTGVAGTLIDAINASGAATVAVDLPSGINGSTGAVMGTAIKAAETVTFFRRKPAHLLLPGRLHCGKVRVANIGISPRVLDHIQPRTFVNTPILWGQWFPIPRISAHKYARGHAVVVSGPLWRTGAARLAARAALRAGAGLVTLASPREALSVNAATSLAVMVHPVDGARELAGLLSDHRFNALAIGPGGGVGGGMRDLVSAALDGERAVVLDADALTSFADDPSALWSSIAARGDGAARVLTPHQGEFARLFTDEAFRNAPSKLDAARAAASHSHAVVVLKGADTVIAAPDGRAAINDNAPPWLATAGSGDALTGLVTGLLAQGMKGFEAACAAVWLHGEAATTIGPGLISEDLSEAMPQVYTRLIADLGGP
jgi:ADP-dependent NAD(P)H-hydrate dehydratase / NAD(P)H-hydrate epimerase